MKGLELIILLIFITEFTSCVPQVKINDKASPTPINSCSGFKCEFRCDDGHQLDGDRCVLTPIQYNCLGQAPERSTLCSGDEDNLLSNQSRKAVNDCSNRKCEYQCEDGYQVDGNSCEKIPSGTAICEAKEGKKCYYIAPGGDDSNPGTFAKPFASTRPLIPKVDKDNDNYNSYKGIIKPGDIIYFRGGEYAEKNRGYGHPYKNIAAAFMMAYILHLKGTSDNPITFKAYPRETPKIDLYKLNLNYNPDKFPFGNGGVSSDVSDAFRLDLSSHIVISGFDITHGSIHLHNSKYIRINDNHIHDLATCRSNNGLVYLYGSQYIDIENNHLHNTYERMILLRWEKDPEIIKKNLIKLECEAVKKYLSGYKDPKKYDHKKYDYKVVPNDGDYFYTDGRHHGCITLMSEDGYKGFGSNSSTMVNIKGNDISDCPGHLFFKNTQGADPNYDKDTGIEDNSKIRFSIEDNYFHGKGALAYTFKGSHVLFKNNLFNRAGSIKEIGGREIVCTNPDISKCKDAASNQEKLNEINGRNISFENNIFLNVENVLQIHGLGYSVDDGIYSDKEKDKLHFINNLVLIREGGAASSGNATSWSSKQFIFANNAGTQIDTSWPSLDNPSKTLSRLEIENNCFINEKGDDVRFFKYFAKISGTIKINGYSYQSSKDLFGIDATGNIFNDDISTNVHFKNITDGDYSIKSSSPCSHISSVGLSDSGKIKELINKLPR